MVICPECGCNMHIRKGYSEFYGCENYNCNKTLQLDEVEEIEEQSTERCGLGDAHYRAYNAARADGLDSIEAGAFAKHFENED